MYCIFEFIFIFAYVSNTTFSNLSVKMNHFLFVVYVIETFYKKRNILYLMNGIQCFWCKDKNEKDILLNHLLFVVHVTETLYKKRNISYLVNCIQCF